MDKKPAQFRETMWFKVGESKVSEQAADDAASNTSLPVEDRYLDDGSVTPTDSLTFGIHTGTTTTLRQIHASDSGSQDLALGTLAREMKGHRPMYAALVAGAVSIATVALIYLI
ncbi:MAG: hypothetical protein H0T89_18535 [Deltaproteobacteria bacterium]|nr:hypothetical protein [Deltaproteobacteria bacterium]MDQ3298666.1 hypothetical protein [Myxococcota bacterium]